MRLKIVTLFIFIGTLLSAQARNQLSINSNWQFHKGDTGENNQSIDWENINIPHTWNARDVLDDTPGIHTGICWYKKQLYVPSSMQGKQVYLYFEGANQDATVYLNGKQVGTHLGGYTAFCFNITDFLGDKGNILEVKLDNSLNPAVAPVGGDMERFGGIYRDVYLISMNEIHFDIDFFASSGVFITTPSITDKEAKLIVESHIVNPEKEKVQVKHFVYNNNVLIAEFGGKAGSDISNHSFALKNPIMWSPASPDLYTLISQIVNKKGVVFDEITQYFGVRTLQADKDKGIILNGEPIFIKGIGKHQDYAKIGYAVPNEVLSNDVVLIKEMGANLLRSHYPLDPVTYDVCDRIGVMAWGKIPIMDKVNHSAEFMLNTKNMMQEVMYQNFNRPSFILWGFACEIFGDMDWYWQKPQNPAKVKKNLEKTEAFSDEMEAFIRSIDPYRLTANDFHTDPTPEFYKQANQTNLQMVNGWNIYQGWYHNNLDSIDWALKTFRAYNPDVPFLIAEFGVGSDPRIHTYNPTIFDFSIEYQDIFHSSYLNTVKDYDFVHGMCIWTLVDFQVAARADAVPHINSKGLLKANREPKDAYYLYQAHWSEKPMVHIATSDWTNRKEIVQGETAERKINVYSNQNEVELYCNGKSLGTKKVENCIVTFKISFVNGKNSLLAVVPNAKKYISDAVEVNYQFVDDNLNESFPENGLCINIGQSRTYFTDDLTKNIWMPDKEYKAGSYGHKSGDYYTHYPDMRAWNGIRQGVGQNIRGTNLDPVFQTFLTGVNDYIIDVPKGRYEVTLLFAEPFSTEKRKNNPEVTGADESGARIFDVNINNKAVCIGLNIAVQFGELVAIEKMAVVNAESSIKIELKAIKGQPLLSGVKLRKL
jgi:beta-galactosidase